MAKTIDTVADDIKALFGDTLTGTTTSIEEAILAKFGVNVAMAVQRALEARREGGRKPQTLYMSEVGSPCTRKVWYGVHKPEAAEPMADHTLFKFLYGDVLEEVVLLLAEAAGHTVERRQEQKEIVVSRGNGLPDWKIRGRIDAVIDGVLVDVKSCSPFGFKKFEEGLSDENDSFGYRVQLNSYNLGTFERQGFLAVDKQNGKVGWFETPFESPVKKVVEVVNAVQDTTPPKRAFELVPEGKSGNLKLGMECSYCAYKQECWKDSNHGTGLRAFAYSTGPVFLGTVVNPPRVREIVLSPIPKAA